MAEISVSKSGELVTGTAEDDSIKNYYSSYIPGGLFYSGGYTGFTSSSCENVTIDSGDGNDTIYSPKFIDGGENVIIGGKGNDSMEIGYRGYLLQYAKGDGNDTVKGFGAYDTLQITSGTVDTIYNDGKDVVVKVGQGSILLADVVNTTLKIQDASGKITEQNFFYAETISATSDKGETISSSKDYTVLNGGESNDTISNSAHEYVTLVGSAGDDSIKNSYSPVFDIQLSSAILSSNVMIRGDEGNDSLTNTGGNNVTIDGGLGDDCIVNTVGAFNNHMGSYTTASVDKALIYGDAGNDTITNTGSKTTIDGGAGDDYITNESKHFSRYVETQANNVVIYGGNGNDTIKNVGLYVTIPGSATYVSGKNSTAVYYDYKCYGSEKFTINGGAGDDYVSLGMASEGVIIYNEGDGNDTISGSGKNTTLQISGSYSTLASGINMLVKVGDGSILLTGRANDSVNIVGGTMVQQTENSTTPAQDNTDTTPTETSTSQPTETPVTPLAETNVLQIENSRFTYSGGNKNIITYTSEKINFQADFTGIGFNATDFMINSSSGNLAIKNARDKILDVAVNNNTVAYAYYASGGGNLDGGSFSVLEVIIGGNNSANTITAGSGGSSLWGGAGGNDIFTGGAGQDTFFYGKNDGTDIINNAGSSDIVNLYDVSLADIISANVSGSQISVTFNTGSDLQINSAENLSAKFNLADGSFKFNHSSGIWQNA